MFVAEPGLAGASNTGQEDRGNSATRGPFTRAARRNSQNNAETDGVFGTQPGIVDTEQAGIAVLEGEPEGVGQQGVEGEGGEVDIREQLAEKLVIWRLWMN